nr:putative hydrolase [Candidatus Pantoea persica]
MPLLKNVRKPLLIVHAKDDPFITDEVIPQPEQLSATTTYQLTPHGGHVGFVGGTLRHPQMWLEQPCAAVALTMAFIMIIPGNSLPLKL